MPSRALLGLQTESGWTVTSDLNNHKMVSGGNFCTRWLAESSDGKIGFMKAMDFSRALAQGIQAVQQLTNEYLFEREILDQCKSLKMTKIVTPLDAGELSVPNFSAPLNTVYYLIFEKADGDLRQQFLNDLNHDSWVNVFRALHHVAVGAGQLHRARIAHQDIKPSNVLCFNEDSKLSDLGRVTDANGRSPFLSQKFTGDPTYEPIEGNFGMYGTDFSDRFHTDIYMVGSLAYQLITGVQISAKIIEESRLITPHILSMSYNDALPVLISTFNTMLERYHEKCSGHFDEKMAEDLRTIVFEMCHPDKSKRGAPNKSRTVHRLSFDRYIGKFATLAKRAQVAGLY